MWLTIALVAAYREHGRFFTSALADHLTTRFRESLRPIHAITAV